MGQGRMLFIPQGSDQYEHDRRGLDGYWLCFPDQLMPHRYVSSAINHIAELSANMPALEDLEQLI